MRLKTLRDNFLTVLKEDFPDTEIQSFFYLLTDHFLKMKRLDVTLNLNMQISTEKLEKFENAIGRLKNHEPIQYIIGQTEFYGLPFRVNENTLIPRPETEELVAWILDSAKASTKGLSILDIGTGTGCIAISLAENLPSAKVYAIDVSQKALTIAKHNAKLNDVNVRFFEVDILDWRKNSGNLGVEDLKFDLIVSNPPYVRELEKTQMQTNVLDYEPALALFVTNDDPLVFYKEIIQFAMEHLKDNGKLFFEINQYLGVEMLDLLDNYNFENIILKKDIFGNDRMISGTKTR